MEFPELTDEEEKALHTQVEEKEEEKEPDEEESETEAEPEEKKAAEPEEKKEEKSKTEEPAVEAPRAPEDKSAAARYRFEASEERRKREAVEARLAEVTKKPLPDKEENYEGHIEAKIETAEQRLARLEDAEAKRQATQSEQDTVVGALNELKQYESAYSAAAPDYQEASNHLKAMIATSIKLLEPGIDPETLAKKTIKTFLSRAGAALHSDVNPAQAIYNQALQCGYRKKEATTEAKEEKKTNGNFEKVAENKKKSPGMIGTGSGSKPPATAEATDKMSNRELEEFARLNPEELERLMYG